MDDKYIYVQQQDFINSDIYLRRSSILSSGSFFEGDRELQDPFLGMPIPPRGRQFSGSKSNAKLYVRL
jgi:hypothetical protein